MNVIFIKFEFIRRTQIEYMDIGQQEIMCMPEMLTGADADGVGDEREHREAAGPPRD